MTTMKLVLTLLTATFTSASFADLKEVPIVDAPQPDQVIQSVTFKGAPHRVAMASIIDPQDGSELILWITHQKPNDVRYYSVVDTNKLGLVHGGMAGTESSLGVSKSGSLLIHQQNQSVGRDRWERTLTVTYVNGNYVVSGFTYASRDTLTPDSGQSCDYNLLTGQGMRNGKPVAIKTKPVELDKLSDNEKMYSCEGL